MARLEQQEAEADAAESAALDALMAARAKKDRLRKQRKQLKRREQEWVDESGKFVEDIEALEAVEALNREVAHLEDGLMPGTLALDWGVFMPTFSGDDSEFAGLDYGGTAQVAGGSSGATLMWVFTYKFDEDGYLYRFKARLVVRGDLEQLYGDTYAATLAARTFRALIAIANQFGLELLQYDVPNAFLNATLNRKLYAETPDGFKKDGELLQVLRALLDAYTGISMHIYREFEKKLEEHYGLKCLGELKWFLGIRVVRDINARTIHLVQDAYIDKVAAKYNIISAGRLLRCLCWRTIWNSLWRSRTKLGQRPIRSFLQAQAINEVEIQEYLATPQDYRDPIFFGASDASFADDVETRRSSQGYVFQLFGMTVDWKSTLQRTVTKSTTEAELLALSLAGSETDFPTSNRAGTVATTEAGEGGQDETNSALVENFDGIDWARLPDFIKPLARSKRPKSWIFQYGYRVVERHATSRIWFVCKYCHVHKTIDAGRGGLFNITQATTSAATHLSQPKPGHNLTKDGQNVQQNTANAFGNFDVEGFRTATVMWLVNRNHPLSELTTPDFREMMRFANPEAEAALWVSNTSVSTFVMRLFRSIRPQVIDTLSGSVSKIHVSFDGWTTKAGIIRDLPIDLPELAGAHTGEAIAKAISTTLSAYGITSDRLGYLYSTTLPTTTLRSALAREYEFESAHRRLRCSCHTLNLIGQAIIFGTNKDAYGNTQEQYNTEEQYMREWRKDGPIGVLVDVINYIKTPQQYELFRGYQRLANNNLPAEGVSKVILEDAHAAQRNNKRPDAPNWMRSTGLRAADWAVIAEYQDCLEPLKYATKRLEGRSKDGKYGAIYEVIPVFEYVLSKLEAGRAQDHLNVNLRAAWSKANDYYNKLDDSPAYYAAVCLHPYYKNYCDVAWADKADWLTSANASFQQLWAAYKPQRARQRYTTAPSSNNIDEAIIAILSRNNDREAPLDEFERWKTQEPQWTQEQYNADGNPVQYWIQLLPKYPHLAQFAIDIMTIQHQAATVSASSVSLATFLNLNDVLWA
ncbi:Dimer-Tnp-hAT domain containing protein [Pyrenophora tritici-repentis]|uniref:Dimer-Tnp-hAT domain containing protein n=2 Tax=Pyrenophora tritici-repentis TaxID=45151 RepID=A0A834VY95_9PLEO|nr:Dimer-Tnp-hAT domain containing protein [Pyrenophora tritici-repentis]